MTTITLSHLNPVGAGFISGWNCHRKPGSSRQVVSKANIRSSNYNQFCLSLSSVYSRPITTVASTSYDRIGGSSLSLSSPSIGSSSSPSVSHSSSCNCQNTSPSIHINIVLPYSLQLCASVFVTILANLYSKLQPLLDRMFKRRGSVLFFQVAVLDKERALQRKLKKIAENADTSTLNGLNYVLKEVVKAVLQYNYSSIHFTKLSTSYGSMMGLSKTFEEFLNRELQRHGEDESTLVNADDTGEDGSTLVNADETVEYKNKASMVKANSCIENEYTVVTILVLATHEHSIPYFKEKGRSCHDSFEVFQTLKRIPENEIQSIEVLWSPRKDDEVLLEDKLLRDFPRLIRIENGLIRMEG